MFQYSGDVLTCSSESSDFGSPQVESKGKEPLIAQHNRVMPSSSNHVQSGNYASTLSLARQSTRKLATSHYENFLIASILLPKELRQPFYDVYAFCRTADDLADESPSPDEALRGLDVCSISLMLPSRDTRRSLFLSRWRRRCGSFKYRSNPLRIC